MPVGSAPWGSPTGAPSVKRLCFRRLEDRREEREPLAWISHSNRLASDTTPCWRCCPARCGRALAGKSTLNRLEHAPGDGKPGRYHKITHDPEALQALLTELFIESWPGRLPPSRLVLDIDFDGRCGARSPGGPLLPRWSGRPLPAASQCAKMVLSDLDLERSDHLREEASNGGG